jgi:hypothetical protein
MFVLTEVPAPPVESFWAKVPTGVPAQSTPDSTVTPPKVFAFAETVNTTLWMPVRPHAYHTLKQPPLKHWLVATEVMPVVLLLNVGVLLVMPPVSRHARVKNKKFPASASTLDTVSVEFIVKTSFAL